MKRFRKRSRTGWRTIGEMYRKVRIYILLNIRRSAFWSLIASSNNTNEEDRLPYIELLNSAEGLALSFRESVTRLAHVQSTLGRKHNEGVGINKLPTEVMCIIFWHAIAREASRKTYVQVLSPLDVAAVCSHWRSIAIACSPLWSVLDVPEMSTNQFNLYRQRAKGYPLTLLACDPFAHEITRDLVFTSIHAISSLSIVHEFISRNEKGNSQKMHKFLTSAPSSPPIHLEYFSCSLGLNISRPDLNVFPAVLDSHLFGGQTPSLRHISFSGTRLPWNQGFYRDLFTLEIGCSLASSALDEDICLVLRDCPRLRKLKLVLIEDSGMNFARNDHSQGGHTLSRHRSLSDPVPLPHLQHLELVAPANYLHHILSCIVADDIRELYISILSRATGDNTTAFSLPFLIPTCIFPCLDALDIHLGKARQTRPSVQSGYIKGCTVGRGTTQLIFCCQWELAEGDRTTDTPDTDMAQILGRAMRPYLKPTVIHKLSLLGPKLLFTPALISDILSLFASEDAPDNIANAEGQQSSLAAPLPTPESMASKTIHTPHPSLEALQLHYREMTFSEVNGLIEWCKGQSSLRYLHLGHISFHLPDHSSVEDLRLRFLDLGLGITFDFCLAIFPDSNFQQLNF